MNKFFTLLIAVIFLTGCSSEKNTTVKEEQEKYNYTTTCTLSNDYDKNENEYNIRSTFFSIDFCYNTLDDKEVVEFMSSTIDFDSWQDAKTYYDKFKDEYKGISFELSDEDIDTVSVGYIDTSDYAIEKMTPREAIEEQKKQGYECETKNNKDTND